ncbi:MAG: hypothetical protein HY013_21120, partial [Candidatus Solibacter usitatus]|nr:hypothetical protein [Candidatus Solibacter usitatus]
MQIWQRVPSSSTFAALFFVVTCCLWGEDVLTQRNNNLRAGASSWPGLDQHTVRDFQLLASLPVDGPVLAQPLVVQILNFRGEQHSVLWVATATNNIYAFNADPPFQQLGPPIYLGPPYAPSSTEVDKLGGGALLTYVDGPNGRYPIIGVESTPVIDDRRKMMFVGYRRNSGLTGQQRLAAIDITTGVVKRDVAIPGSVTWHELHRNRASLLLDNNVLYIAFAA